jgi:Dyp-type peroxidase family
MLQPVETDEVQGNVLYAYGVAFPVARHVLLRIENGAKDAAAKVIAGWFRQVTFGRRPTPPEEPNTMANAIRSNALRPHVNVAFTYAGLEALGLPDDQLFAFPEDFRQGAWCRSPGMDRGANSREHWEKGWRDGRAHLLLSVHATREEERDACVDSLLAAAVGEGGPLAPCVDQPTALLSRPPEAPPDSCGVRYDREHFGFADGCSQPAIEGVHDDPVGGGLYTRVPALRGFGLLREDLFARYVRRRWRLIRPGEFLLGYENEDGRLPDGPASPLGPNGSFVVYRKLEQHVETFDDYVKTQATDPDMANGLRARIVGRWPDGTPLATSPHEPDPDAATSRRRANDFTYGDDPQGLKCPLGAHVRRTNPRNAPPGGAEMTMRHRIIRRGMPYGKRSDKERGLLFICYSSSISEGFEFVQRFWCDDGDAFGLGNEPDLLLQQPEAGERSWGMVVDADPKRLRRLVPPEKPFVSLRGCEYLFVPSRRACEWLGGLLNPR